MRNILALSPTTNYALASPSERSDAMQALGRVLMGLSHPVQLIGQAREVAFESDWPRPPKLERRWLAVVTADDDTTLAWRTNSLRSALEGIGLRCSVVTDAN